MTLHQHFRHLASIYRQGRDWPLCWRSRLQIVWRNLCTPRTLRSFSSGLLKLLERLSFRSTWSNLCLAIAWSHQSPKFPEKRRSPDRYSAASRCKRWSQNNFSWKAHRTLFCSTEVSWKPVLSSVCFRAQQSRWSCWSATSKSIHLRSNSPLCRV